LGTRTETKNVNSLRSVERAVRYEIQRQAAVLDAGSVVVQETRHFAEGDGTTLPGRVKEEAEDYRYFPEPDLVPITPSAQWVEGLRATLPEAPSLRRKRLQAAWGVPDHEMAALVNAGALDVVEQTVRLGADPGSARKWWLGEVARRANETGKDIGDLPISASEVARVVALVEEGRLNDKIGRQVIEAVLDGEGSPDDVIARRGLEVVSDDAVLTAAIDEALAAAPDIAAKIAGGKTAAAGAIVGVVMRTTRGQADAARVRELILARYQS
jgi:aspartyl-tRNA(Asn)/glutamyl-tRNA(Gln) amidotransferase subunit B